MEKIGIEVWDRMQISQKSCAFWSFPCRNIYVERLATEYHVLSLQEPNEEADARRGIIARGKKPVSSQWRHYLVNQDSAVQPDPTLPDRPVVVKPDRALTLLPGESATFFLQIPVWFRLSTSNGHKTRIFEEPVHLLSNTWFGDPVTGELCYALATRLHQGLDSIEPRAFHAICPVLISNDSEQDLAFEKICIHVENLKVFRGSRRLWANSLNVIFKGSEQTTQIEVAPDAPLFEKYLVEVSGARVAAESWNIKKTFSMLKYFTDA